MKNLRHRIIIPTSILKINLLLFLAVCFMASVGTNADGRTLPENSVVLANTISGTVFDEKGQPVTNAFVELQDEFYRNAGQTKTGSSGRYSFSGMTSGRYTIKVIAGLSGYPPQTVEVEVVSFGSRRTASGGTISNSDYVQQDIYLQPRKTASNAEQINGVVYAQTIPANAKTTYQKAIALLEDKNETLETQNKAEGIKTLEQSVTEFPTYYMALNRLGYEYFQQENFAKASEYMAKAADVNPSEPTLYLLSYSLFLEKNYDVAIEVAKRAASLYPSSRIYTILGGSYRITKKYDEAEEALKKAESLDKDYAEAHWELALLYGNNLKKYGEAANQLETFMKLQPNSKDSAQIKKLIKQFREKKK